MTNDEKEKLYQLLSAPFPEEAIERTDGRQTGKGYSTTGIKAQFIINRLNDVLGFGNWRTHREISVKEIASSSGRKAFAATCDLVLECGEWLSGEFVVFAEALADGGHTSASEGDARKGSFSNALKKGAAMFGCGRQAYEGTLDDDNQAGDADSNVAAVTTVVRAPVVITPVQSVPPGYTQTPDVRPPQQERNRLSSRQLSAIWSIARKLGHEQSGFRSQVRMKYGVQLEFLSRNQASELITSLNARLNSNGNGQHVEEPVATDGVA